MWNSYGFCGQNWSSAKFSNLQSSLLRCGTRPNELGTQWESNDLLLSLFEDPKPVSDRLSILSFPLVVSWYCTQMAAYAPTMTNDRKKIAVFTTSSTCYFLLSQMPTKLCFSKTLPIELKNHKIPGWRFFVRLARGRLELMAIHLHRTPAAHY